MTMTINEISGLLAKRVSVLAEQANPEDIALLAAGLQKITGPVALQDLQNQLQDALITLNTANSLAVNEAITHITNEANLKGSELANLLITGNAPGDLTVGGTLQVNGDLVVNGTSITQNATTVEIADNLLLLNRNENGVGVTAGKAGLEIERGTLSNYQLVFEETSGLFKIGTPTALQAVATREDTPVANSLAYWDGSSKSYRSIAGLSFTAPVLGFSGISLSGTIDAASALRDSGTAISLPLPGPSQGNIQRLRLTANCTITLPSFANLPANSEIAILLELLQDPTGGRTASFAASDGRSLVYSGYGSMPALQTAANQETHFNIRARADGTAIYISRIF
jgi:hypothetical protein